ncbi:MAG: sulfatase [Candidatus Hydrogenedens sp.]|nr:sulfatase [Candidatus Hydrogenedens sp.]
MIKRIITWLGRSLLWCLPASLGLAALEALGNVLIAEATPLPLPEFILRFSNSSLLLLSGLMILWLFMSIVPVWLGGVRGGIALLFIFSFFFLYTYLTVVLDILFTFTDRYVQQWTTLMRYFGLFSFLGAGALSLLVGKITRNKEISLSPRYFFALNLFLAMLAMAFNNGHFYHAGFVDSSSWIAALVLMLLITVSVVRISKGSTPMVITLLLLLGLVHGSAVYARFSLHDPQPKVIAQQSGTTQPAKRIILITVDTLRQDALGLYNRGATQTPHLDALGRDSLVFTQAYTCAPWTYPSVASFLTGVSPGVHGMVDGKTALPREIPTLAEAMQKAGYHSCAIGSNSLLLPRSGLDRGFNEYHWFPQQKLEERTFSTGLSHNLLLMAGRKRVDATSLTDLAIDWLQQHEDETFFLWLHYFDPHIPYAPPEEWLPEDPELKALGNRFGETWSGRAGSVARTPKEREWIRALYQGDVAYTDAQIGRLLGALKILKLYDDTLIILTSDHGEEFWDHGHFEHGHCLYNELMCVPFLWKQPGNNAREEKHSPITTEGIMPTLLELCGLKVPDYLAHNSLVPHLADEEEDCIIAPVFLGSTLFHDPLEAVVFEEHKYLRSLNSSREELYNLQEDPRELEALPVRDSEMAARGQELLQEARDKDEALRSLFRLEDSEEQRIDLEDIRSLQALGYL